VGLDVDGTKTLAWHGHNITTNREAGSGTTLPELFFICCDDESFDVFTYGALER